MFGQSRVRKLLTDQGAQRVQKLAVEALNEEIVRFGKVIIQIALKDMEKNNRQTFQEEDIDVALTKYKSGDYEVEKEFNPFFHHIWLLDEDSGMPLLSRSFSGLKFDDTVFSGLLLGIVNLMREATGRELRHLVLGDLTIHLRKFNSILIASICDSDDDIAIDRLTAMIGLDFISRYKDELHERVKDMEIFREFESTLEQAVTSSGMELPTQVAIEASSPIEAATLSRESIEDIVTGAALREDLQSALKLLREHPVFKKKE